MCSRSDFPPYTAPDPPDEATRRLFDLLPGCGPDCTCRGVSPASPFRALDPEEAATFRAWARDNPPTTEVVPGLVIERRTLAHRHGAQTHWTAIYRGELIGQWYRNALIACWVRAPDGSRERSGLLYLRDWRHAVVAIARGKAP